MGKLIDLTGLKFERLRVICRAGSDKDKNAIWLCVCDCGNIKITTGKRLLNGQTKSCGCLHKELASQRRKKDLTGKRFGKLIVLYDTDKRINGHVLWHCRCDCGNYKDVLSRELINGDTNSCGCLYDLYKGEGHPMWNGGITSLLNKIRHSKRNRKWIKQIFERDNYTCQYCGQVGYELNAHHIKPFSHIIEENNITTLKEAHACGELWLESNGMTLCGDCHRELHKKIGKN